MWLKHTLHRDYIRKDSKDTATSHKPTHINSYENKHQGKDSFKVRNWILKTIYTRTDLVSSIWKSLTNNNPKTMHIQHRLPQPVMVTVRNIRNEIERFLQEQWDQIKSSIPDLSALEV